MDKQYRLISTFDGNDTIEFSVNEKEHPETRALEELGWFIVPVEEEKNETE
jgi:hypothetical protein